MPILSAFSGPQRPPREASPMDAHSPRAPGQSWKPECGFPCRTLVIGGVGSLLLDWYGWESVFYFSGLLSLLWVYCTCKYLLSEKGECSRLRSWGCRRSRPAGPECCPVLGGFCKSSEFPRSRLVLHKDFCSNIFYNNTLCLTQGAKSRNEVLSSCIADFLFQVPRWIILLSRA